MFEIQCLWCAGFNVMDSSTYIKFRIDGMSIDCTGCGSQCSLETLSSKRLWDGIEAYRADSSVLLAGSLLSPWTGNPDPDAAQREHHHLFFHPRIQFGLDQANVALNCTWPKVIQTFQDLGPDQYYGVRPTTLARIISSYMGLVEDRLSMDLVAGALRQRDFQKAMMVTGGQAWCQPQVLERSLDRYKKFMFLARAESKHTAAVEGGGVAGMATMAAGGGTLGAGQPGRHALVPTLDIDLAWHTHMLSPLHYRQYQLIHYQRVLNHDDTVQATSSMTRQDFVRTAELWQNLYQEQYSSQQAWRSGIKWTPGRVCASIVFPPYGAYVVWKRWKVKRKSKKLNQGASAAATAVADLEVQNVENKKKKKWMSLFRRSKKNKGKEIEPTTRQSDEVRTDTNAGPGMQLDLRVEETVIREDDPQIDESLEQPAPSQGHDAKGKGKATSEHDTAVVSPGESSSAGQAGATGLGTGSSGPANRNVGLDGRLSNWNGDTAAPDG
ncbi:hypothetical protein BGX34_001155 [Mortierella sp. NVP85]|nr:hypothetical protein BGX34_001155 [Mortierella sp. NVP85]